MSKLHISAEQDALFASRGDFMIERHIASAMNAAHWHDHVELNYLLDGQMTYIFNGRQEQVEAGRLVLFWAAIPHRTIAVTPNAPLVCIYLPLVDFLSLPIERGARGRIMQGQILCEPRQNPIDGAVSQRWLEEWTIGDAARRELVFEEVKLRVRRLFLDSGGENENALRPSKTTNSATAVRHTEVLTDLINKHFDEPLTVPQLAKRAGVHPATANKAFQKVLGTSPNEYLIRYRIARAMQLLADTDDPVLKIAFDCGFGSSSRFYQLFKHRTGDTPLVFRKSISRKTSQQR